MKTTEDVGSPLKYEFQVWGPLEFWSGHPWGSQGERGSFGGWSLKESGLQRWKWFAR